MFQKMIKFNCNYFSHFFMTGLKKNKALIYPKNFSNYQACSGTSNYYSLNINNIKIINKKIFDTQTPKKSINYLINRYIKHVVYKYELYAIKNEKFLHSIFVFRLCKHKNSTAIRIIDYIGEEKNFFQGKYLFNYLLNKYSADFIDIYCYGIKQKYIEKSGLINIEKYSNKKLVVPNYFEPFEKKKLFYLYLLNLLKKTYPFYAL